MERKFCSKVSNSTQSTSQTELKSKSINLDRDFVSSVQTFDLQCSYLRCSWDTVTFAHVETAGWFLWRPLGLWALTEVSGQNRARVGAANINLPLRCFFWCSQFSQQRYAAENQSSTFARVLPGELCTCARRTIPRLLDKLPVFSCRFLIDLGQPQNRKWLSFNWRSTSSELYFFSGCWMPPSTPFFFATLRLLATACYHVSIQNTKSDFSLALGVFSVCFKYLLYAHSHLYDKERVVVKRSKSSS